MLDYEESLFFLQLATSEKLGQQFLFRAFPVSHLQSPTCAFSCVLIDELRKKRGYS